MLNLNSTDPTLSDVLTEHKKDLMLSMNCHSIAKIESFNSSNQTCEASLVYSKTYNTRNDDGTYTPEQVEYPLLLDCPVIVLGGGQSGLTMPIESGDECLILFNDRDIDNWFKGATSGKVASTRKHSFSDGIALVGLKSLSNSISDYDNSNPVLFNGDTKITLKEQKIKIENSVESLNDILQDLIIAINGIVTTNCVIGNPVALNPASIATINLVATRLGGLLE